MGRGLINEKHVTFLLDLSERNDVTDKEIVDSLVGFEFTNEPIDSVEYLYQSGWHHYAATSISTKTGIINRNELVNKEELERLRLTIEKENKRKQYILEQTDNLIIFVTEKMSDDYYNIQLIRKLE
ncbi:hypothetical protein [Paenibacillus sp. FSL R5-0486]|uniref:hypothetical protein n=1 Tax=Paenibacillus sp. FSL R5-0486 TaxID=2921645 RepID=UPI0030D812EB